MMLNSAQPKAQKGRAILIILDGFGIGKSSAFNAIENAKTPFLDQLIKKYPHSQILTHGEYVGLPSGIMGNSEVGHLSLGSGRIVDQDLTRISKSIQNKSFFKNPVLTQTLEKGAQTTGRVHLMGLLSDGGVHSHIDHLLALLDLCLILQIPQIGVHAFLDGRDTPPGSAPLFLERLLTHPAFQQKKALLVTLMGRYWAMDRDQRWERTERAHAALTGQTQETPLIEAQKIICGNQDEFVEPLLVLQKGAIQSGDSVVFFNFRSDRARQISQALLTHTVQNKKLEISAFAGMTEYQKNLPLLIAFPPEKPTHVLGECLEKHRLRQFRIAETEKYAHVTFFFNGGQESPFQLEDRLLIPSPQEVRTYDLKPEMSAFVIAQQMTQRIQKKSYDFMLANFANADMVGHTGNYLATVRAIEALDTCLEQVIGTAEKNDYHVLLTADHGNAEEMQDDQGRNHTQHTLNPVPAIWIAPQSYIRSPFTRKSLKDGLLCDIMPTLCNLIGIKTPKEVTGKSLIHS